MSTGVSGSDSGRFSQRLSTASFPHACDPLQLKETHISWVVLTGRWAYKVKKPLRFDFLDYSTKQRRLDCCHAELQINRQWAPQLYVDVVPIFAAGSGLRFGTAEQVADPAAVEYAVQMRQFAQSAMLSQQLAAGQVDAGLMELLGGQLAELHRGLQSVPFNDQLVERGAVQPALDNFDFLLGQIGAAAKHRQRLEQLQDWTRRAIQQLRPLMVQRARQGHLRKCHGDLHLDNLLYLEGRFVPFDGIEFNESLRQIEGWDEVAFLAMELSEHGYRRHAKRLLSRYAEASSDYEGLRLLRYFLVYRAMVRAKVDLIRSRQTSPNTVDTAAGLSEAACRYVDYAAEVTRAGEPELWITHGVSGSGKSTAAAEMVASRGLFRIRSDVERKRLAGLDPSASSPPQAAESLYGSPMTKRTYDRLARLAEQILQAGFGVIVDATFLQRSQREPFIRLAQKYSVAAKILLCRANREELQRRLRQRRADPSDATPEILDRQIERLEAPAEHEGAELVDG